MCREKLEVFWQWENSGVNRIVKGGWVSFLEVGAPTASDQKCVASKSHSLLLTDVGHATCKFKYWNTLKLKIKIIIFLTIGVSWCGSHFKQVASKFYCITVWDVNICLGATGLRNQTLASWEQTLQFSCSCDVVCVHMSVHWNNKAFVCFKTISVYNKNF